MTITGLRLNALFIDRHGSVVAGCHLSDGFQAIVTWSYPEGPRILVKRGDTVQIAPGDIRTVNTVSVQPGIGGSLQPQQTLADDGRVAFSISFSDGSSGIFSTVIPRGCDPIDFNRDGLYPDNQDLMDYLTVFGGGACPTGACGDLDFNNNGLFPENADIEAFFSAFGGGGC